jgi:hypothetical protein
MTRDRSSTDGFAVVDDDDDEEEDTGAATAEGATDGASPAAVATAGVVDGASADDDGVAITLLPSHQPCTSIRNQVRMTRNDRSGDECDGLRLQIFETKPMIGCYCDVDSFVFDDLTHLLRYANHSLYTNSSLDIVVVYINRSCLVTTFVICNILFSYGKCIGAACIRRGS